MPQMTASTARRSMARRARSSAERFCAFADDETAQNKASTARTAFFMVSSVSPTADAVEAIQLRWNNGWQPRLNHGDQDARAENGRRSAIIAAHRAGWQ